MILGPQPNFIDDSKTLPMLNILGVLRPDSLQSESMSFVHLEKSVAVPIDTGEKKEVRDAQVWVFKMENGQVSDTIAFVLTNCDSIFADSAYRPHRFFPKAGETYWISCISDSLPELTSATTLPQVPALVNDTIYMTENAMEFFIVYDSLVSLYDIYLLKNSETYYAIRKFDGEGEDIFVTLPFGRDNIISQDSLEITIYAYDKNLSDYITNSPSAIWPNTFQPSYSTVENGYGCFGSLNILTRIIHQ